MGINDVIERTTIELPKPITLDQSEKLLKYLAEKMNADIDYVVKYHSVYTHENDSIKSDLGSVELTANIRKIDAKNIAFDSFTMKNTGSYFGKVNSINFQLIPDYELEDYNDLQIALWDETRLKVSDYFKNATK